MQGEQEHLHYARSDGTIPELDQLESGGKHVADEPDRNVQFRVNAQLFSKFELLAKADERSVAGQIRKLMAEYVRKMSGRVIDPGEDDMPPVKEEEKK
jgi:hypothetical protein